MEKDKKPKEKPKGKIRKWHFPSLKRTVEAETYGEALKIVNRKEKI